VVRCTLNPARARRPAVAARLNRTLEARLIQSINPSAARMSPITEAILGAILLGACSVFAILPLAVSIPARLEARWVRDAEDFARARTGTSDTLASIYTPPQKIAVALIAMLLGFGAVSIHGAGAQGVAYAFYYSSLLLLAAINLKHALLPDTIVLPTLWVGLLFHASAGAAADHVYGAAAGFLVPYFLGFLFKLTTRKDVIGHGDFKVLSMAGAWAGVSALPVLFGGVVVGFLVTAIAVSFTRMRNQGFIPTGPAYLVASVAVAIGASGF
jgi:leader peptidase (prepilin peptidase) / N-methyltransferase